MTTLTSFRECFVLHSIKRKTSFKALHSPANCNILTLTFYVWSSVLNSFSSFPLTLLPQTIRKPQRQMFDLVRSENWSSHLQFSKEPMGILGEFRNSSVSFHTTIHSATSAKQLHLIHVKDSASQRHFHAQSRKLNLTRIDSWISLQN